MKTIDKMIMGSIGTIIKEHKGRPWEVVGVTMGFDEVRTVTIRTAYRYKLETTIKRETLLKAFDLSTLE